MTDLPTSPDPTREPILVMKAIFDASEYTLPDGNVTVQLADDVSEEISSPSIILFDASDTPLVGEADGSLTRHDEAVQIDIYATGAAEIQQLKRIVDDLVEDNFNDPGGVGNNIFSTLYPGQWTNLDELTQAEGLRRKSQTVTLYRHRGGS